MYTSLKYVFINKQFKRKQKQLTNHEQSEKLASLLLYIVYLIHKLLVCICTIQIGLYMNKTDNIYNLS